MATCAPKLPVEKGEAPGEWCKQLRTAGQGSGQDRRALQDSRLSSQSFCHQVNNLSIAHLGKHKQAGEGSPDRVLPVPVTWIHVVSSRQLQPPLQPPPPDLSFLKLLTWCRQRPFRTWMGMVGAEEELARRKRRQRPLCPAPASECVLGKPWAGTEQFFHGSGIHPTVDDPGT